MCNNRNNIFRTYKTTIGKVRKDGSRVVKAYGCNGYIHCISEDILWMDDQGIAVAGKTSGKAPKVIGKCPRGATCKDFGGFIVMATFPEDLNSCSECPYDKECQKEYGRRYDDEDFNPAWQRSVRHEACRLQKETLWLTKGK